MRSSLGNWTLIISPVLTLTHIVIRIRCLIEEHWIFQVIFFQKITHYATVSLQRIEFELFLDSIRLRQDVNKPWIDFKPKSTKPPSNNSIEVDILFFLASLAQFQVNRIKFEFI